MKKHTVALAKTLSLLFVVGALFGCGGSGGDSTTISTTPPANLQWTKDVYPDASIFKDFCKNPRTSTASHSFSDKQGSYFLEKMWLRSWSEDVYLWYRDLRDFDVNNNDSPQKYFDTRKTTAVTPSGRDKDRFHFYVNTAKNNQQITSGTSIAYGMRLKLLSDVPPRRAVVVYVEADSPAALANIKRGSEIVTVDGADLVFGDDIDTLNSGLFPAQANETHVFGIIDAGSNQIMPVSLRSKVIAENPVKNTKVFTQIATGQKIAYLTFNSFNTYTAESSLVKSFNDLANENISDLVLDLRYNGGGFLAISSQLAYMIAGSTNTSNRTYYKPVFNDKHSVYDPTSGKKILAYPFFDKGIGLSTPQGTDLPSLNLNRVFILTTDSTCSASEALMNGLQGIGVEVIQIGGKTCGKPYGFQATDNCGTSYYTVMFKGVNSQGFGDYADGFYPANSITGNGSVPVTGCAVADDYSKPLGDINEAMLKAALEYRSSGTCPAQTGLLARTTPSSATADDSNSLFNDRRVRNEHLLQNILILNHK